MVTFSFYLCSRVVSHSWTWYYILHSPMECIHKTQEMSLSKLITPTILTSTSMPSHPMIPIITIKILYHHPTSTTKRLSSGSKQHWSFPYEWLNKNQPVSGIILNQVCDAYCWGEGVCKPGDDGKNIWDIDSHAAYLPVMARNENLYKGKI